MRIIHALCSASYTGRGDTTLPLHERIIMMKSDGSILIHSDAGTKPLNYMGTAPKPVITEDIINGVREIRTENTKESLLISCHRVFSDITMDIPGDDPGLNRDGTEGQLHQWLSENLSVIAPDLEFEKNEYATDNGPVDILAVNTQSQYVLVEVKRVATVAALHQLKRYLDGYPGEDEPLCLLIALDVRPKTRERAQKMGIPWIELERHEEGYRVRESSLETPVEDL